MRFNLYLQNHGTVIQDLVLHLQKSLESCGHVAYFGTKLVRGACNIIIENFGPKLVEATIDLASSGTPVIVWASEEITGETFNMNVAESDSHYGDREHWKLRYDNFATVAEHASAVWVSAEPLLPAYRALVPAENPVQFVPHGYAEGFADVSQRPESQKNIDIYFSGTPTPHRKDLLARLGTKHSVLTHHAEAPEFLRREYLSRAKVCLSLRLGPETRLPSSSRIHYLVSNRCFMLQEQCPVPGHLDGVVVPVAYADLPDACAEALAATDRQARADAMLERLRRELPMREIMPRLLDEAFASR